MATAAPVGTAPAIQLNERRVLLLFGVVEVVWLAGLGYILSLLV